MAPSTLVAHSAMMTERERVLLAGLVRSIPRALFGLPVVEIGTGVGASALVISDGLIETDNPAVLFTIDDLRMGAPWVRGKTDGRFEDQSAAIDAVVGDRTNVFPTMMESGAAAGIQRGPHSMVFIDGEHTYSACLADLRNWAPSVAVGGCLVLHDIGVLVTPDMGPTRALLEWWAAQPPGAWNWFVQVESLLALRRGA